MTTGLSKANTVTKITNATSIDTQAKEMITRLSMAAPAREMMNIGFPFPFRTMYVINHNEPKLAE